MNRTDDLRKTFPWRVHAAMAHLPVEFVILNYNSGDDLDSFVEYHVRPLCAPTGIRLVYKKFTGRETYHQAHAYNLAILASTADYFCLMGADTYPIGDYFGEVRRIFDGGADWVEDKRYKGALAMRKSEFIAAGGFDERFEFYGPEDRDLAHRLELRGVEKVVLPPGMIGNFHTPDEVKMQNYRERLTREESSRRMRQIFEENKRNRVLTANPGGWGKWT